MKSKHRFIKRVLERIKRIGFLKFKANLVFLFVLYSAIFVFVLFFYGFLNTHNVITEKQKVKEYGVQIVAEGLADILRNDIYYIKKTADLAAQNINSGERDAGTFENIIAQDGHITGIHVMEEGQLLFAFGEDLSEDISVAMNSTETLVSANDGRLLYHVVKQGMDIIVTKRFPETFYHTIDTLGRNLNDSNMEKSKSGIAVFLMDETGGMITLYEEISSGTAEKNLPILDKLIQNDMEGEAETDGIYYYPIEQTGRTVVVSVEATALAATVDFLFVSISSGVLILLLFLLYWRFQSSIYIPIKRIEKAMDVVIDGDDVDFEVKIDENSEMYSIAQYFNCMIGRLKEYANREYTAMMLSKQAELNALQSQINPHFLYNTLDSIRGLALLNEQENIAKMTKALSSLFKYSISKTDNLSTLGEEIKNVENYLIIQQYRFTGKFIVIKDIDLKEDPYILSCRLPKLTIQPIVENAIYHGLETKLGKGTIKISAYTTEKRLVVMIEDDGIGIPQNKLEQINRMLRNSNSGSWEDQTRNSTGVAIVNVNERIQIYFGELYGLSLYSTPGMGTTVEIVLPLIKEDIQI